MNFHLTRFLGDCAELFDYCNQDMIEAKVKLLLQMSLILIWGTRMSPISLKPNQYSHSTQEPTNPSFESPALQANLPSKLYLAVPNRDYLC